MDSNQIQAPLIDGVSDEQKELLETTQKTLDVQEQQLKSTGQMENTLKLQGKSEKEIFLNK